MPKRRRGSRHADRRPRATRHVPFATLVDRAIAGIPSPFREALDEIALVVADEPSAEQLRETACARTRPCTGCTRASRSTSGAARTCPSDPDHPVPPAARGGLPGAGRPRRRGPDHDPPRARPPPGHRGRGPPPPARHRLTAPAGARSPPDAGKPRMRQDANLSRCSQASHARSPHADRGAPPTRFACSATLEAASP